MRQSSRTDEESRSVLVWGAGPTTSLCRGSAEIHCRVWHWGVVENQGSCQYIFSRHVKATPELCLCDDAAAVAGADEIHSAAAGLLEPKHPVLVPVVVAAAKVHSGLLWNYFWWRLLNNHTLDHICGEKAQTFWMRLMRFLQTISIYPGLSKQVHYE